MLRGVGMEFSEQLARQLLEAIDVGFINEETIRKFRYWHLDAVLRITMQLEGGSKSFLEIKSYIENINIQRLRKQDKIKVGFIANYSQSWIGDELYYLLDAHPKFEPYVFVIANYNGQNDQMVIEEYRRNLEFFKQRNLRVKETLDLKNGELLSWEDIGVKPELCIWMTPWADAFKEHFHLLNYSLDTVHVYIPYGFMIAENEKNDYVNAQYNQLIHNVAWKNFEESHFALEMAKKYAFVGDSNAVYTGYPKMDVFFQENYAVDVWDNVLKKSGNPNAKRIIYAPHHTIDEKEPVHFSTFADNGKMMLELAKTYRDETVWVFKPHPALKNKAIRSGVFSGIDEWNAYEQEWSNMPNAVVMTDGMYHDMFRNSDAMILDSVSFLAEYLYVHKPLLLLRGDGQFFNDFGNSLVQVLYQTQGKDIAAIEAFIQQVVLSENDSKKVDRERFYRKNLDYRSINGEDQSAAQNIFAIIKEQFGKG